MTKLYYGSDPFMLEWEGRGSWMLLVDGLFLDQGRGWRAGEFFIMPHCQNLLINFVKRLFSWKTIEYGYIYKIWAWLARVNVFYALEGAWGGVVIFFGVTNHIFKNIPLPPVLNNHSLIETSIISYIWLQIL